MPETITDTEWEPFFDALFKCVGEDEQALIDVCIPLAKAIDASGYLPDTQRYLDVAVEKGEW